MTTLTAKRESSTLASASSSRLKKLITKLKVAAIVIAATFVVLPAQAAPLQLNIEGLPFWQQKPAEQSLSAVEAGIARDVNITDRTLILRTVAMKLFPGYRISASSQGREITVSFARSKNENWNVKFIAPTLTGEPAQWFARDTEGFAAKLESMLDGVPLESVSWSDRPLQEEIDKLTNKRLPGWKASLIISSAGEEPVLSVSFVPQMPLILAVNPVVVSNSLPTLLHGEFRDGLMGQFAPFVGIPVAWAALHTKEINAWAVNYIDDQRLSSRAATKAEAEFTAAQISKMNVRVESRYYTIAAWAAVYAGTSDKSAELGLHVGRKVPVLPNFDIEAYAEGILGLQDWNLEGRFGIRWRSIRDLWLGAEYDTADDKWWGRLTMDPQLHKPYLWLRVREDGKVNGAFGWKATEYLSFEAEYDARDEDRWRLKMLGNL